MAKKIVRCNKCENRLHKHVIGFLKSEELHCTEFDISVDKDDGCTFGKEGTPKHKSVQSIGVYLSGHESVGGNHTDGVYTW